MSQNRSVDRLATTNKGLQHGPFPVSPQADFIPSVKGNQAGC
jgi:hypothetical protein